MYHFYPCCVFVFDLFVCVGLCVGFLELVVCETVAQVSIVFDVCVFWFVVWFLVFASFENAVCKLFKCIFGGT
jgi:hypothetical protein